LQQGQLYSTAFEPWSKDLSVCGQRIKSGTVKHLYFRRFPVAEAGQKHDPGFKTIGIWRMTVDYPVAANPERNSFAGTFRLLERFLSLRLASCLAAAAGIAFLTSAAASGADRLNVKDPSRR
jgi:hypothetical protein